MIFAGRKVALPRPRVRSAEGRESRFRCIQGYDQLPVLINALSKTLDPQEAVT